MNITRREALKAIAATAVLPAAGSILPLSEDCLFEDLRPDRYYALQGGPYKDTGGWGCPYPAMGNDIVESMRFWEHCRELEDQLEQIESRGFYLSQSQYFGKPYRQYEKILLTKRWMMEFYRRHRYDTRDDWSRRYDEWHDALKATGWKPEYDRMSREELVVIGWKGVDIYRKDN